ncbi:MAG TPA: hypothetical protein VF771_16180 [Longimicrobiaceae bacterium]
MRRSTFPRQRWSYALAPLIALFAVACDSDRLSGPADSSVLPVPAHLVLAVPGAPSGNISLTLTRTGLQVDPPGAVVSSAPTFGLVLQSSSAGTMAGGGGMQRPQELQPGDETTVCPIPPGTYAIVDSSGQVVAVLVVYPDCSTRTYPLT